MNKAVLKEWITELRSGKYKQCTGQLTNGVGFCCLGVLCEMLKERLEIKVATDEYDCICYDNECEFLPEDVSNYTGISENQQNILSRMNDGGSTFSEIADYLDEMEESC